MPLVGIVVFPGSNCEQDVAHALGLLGAETRYIWHLETDLSGLDAILLPGGFAYGDYLRTGAIAAHSPAMGKVRELANKGTPVIGICNGFQILCESGLLPGALRRNHGLKFICRPVLVKVETNSTIFTQNTSAGQVLEIPINHFEGGYYCPQGTLNELNGNGRVVLRYCDRQGGVTSVSNPNGALDNIAGIISEKGNVMGLMPHPERSTDPELGGTDGKLILSSMLESAVTAGVLTA